MSAAAGAPEPPAPLQTTAVPGGVVYTVHPSADPHRKHYGVVRDDGSLVASTIDDRHHGEHLFIAPDTGRFDTVETLSREVSYAGPLYHVYGHFMIESCQRLWWAARHPELPIVWTVDEHTEPELRPWQHEMLELLGVQNEIVLITRPTRFELVHVPDAGYKYADWTHPQHIEFLAAYDGPPQEPGARLWLSRDPAHGRGLLNREIVERRLRDLGWTIVTFEQMTVREQLDALARAEVIAGEEASTFHNLLLLKDVSAKRFHIFRRHGPEHLSFRTIGDARDVDQQFHSCSQDAVLSAAGRAVLRVAPNPAQYLSHLGIPIPRPAPVPSGSGARSTVRLLDRLAAVTGAATYLQLGAGTDQAFDRVGVNSRTVVDERFPFDVRSHRDRGASFYELSLADFLDHFADGQTYDLVLVDHGRGQRDTLDTLDVLLDRAGHERTVVLLDRVEDVDLAAFALRWRRPDLNFRIVGSRLLLWRHHPRGARRLLTPVSERRALQALTDGLERSPVRRLRRLLGRVRARLRGLRPTGH